MTIEAAVVINSEGQAIYWHEPKERTSVSLPDSEKLWRVIWDNRQEISGIAHSHPGSGLPGPSEEDVTTFAGIEAALGRRLLWWITSSNRLVVCWWVGPHKYSYQVDTVEHAQPNWLPKLRKISNYHHQQTTEVPNGERYYPGQ